MMRIVRVHRQDTIRPGRQGLFESGNVRRAQPQLAGAMNHRHARILGRHLVGNEAGAVRRVVVHDDDVHANRQVEQLRHQQDNILAFVVGWNNDG